jgi:hypothetical protein
VSVRIAKSTVPLALCAVAIATACMDITPVPPRDGGRGYAAAVDAEAQDAASGDSADGSGDDSGDDGANDSAPE